MVYQYDQLNRVTRIRENNAASGIGVLATYSYTPTGQRAAVTYGNGTSRSYAYDTAGRTTGVKLDLAGAEHDLVIGAVAGAGTPVSYNPAGQIVSLSRSNDLYAWTAHSLFERDYGVNGINQYTSAGGVTIAHDGRGNLTTSGSSTYGYSRLNELTSAPKPGGGTIQLTYDPKGRLTEVNPGTPVRMVYAGPNLVTETGQTGTVLRRYVHGPGADDPIVWYEGSGTPASAGAGLDRRWLQADQLGSIAAISNASGTSLGINRYDEYGIPQSGNLGRFQYTGQTWWGELGLYNYKARWYSASLGRFMQTDPIGYEDNLNLYTYVGNDPVNGIDPRGTKKCSVSVGDEVVQPTECGGDDPPPPLPAGTTIAMGDPGRSTRRLNTSSESESDNCEGGRATFGFGVGLTGFFGKKGLTANLEIGVTHGTEPGGQLYVRASVAGLFGVGAYAGSGYSVTAGTTSAPLTTGHSTDKVVAAGGAWGAGAEAMASMGESMAGPIADPSITVGPEGGLGGYLAGGERHTLTGVLIGGC